MPTDPFYLWWVAERGQPPGPGESNLLELCRSVWDVRLEVEDLDEPRAIRMVRSAWESAGPEYPEQEQASPQDLSVVAQFQRDYEDAAPPRPKAYNNTHVHTAAAIKMRIGADQPLAFVAQDYGYSEEAVCVVLAAFEVSTYSTLHALNQWDARDLADAEQNARDEYPKVSLAGLSSPAVEELNKIRAAEQAAYLVGRQHEQRLQTAKEKSP